MLTVSWYRFRATFRRRWPGYLAIVVLIGLVGGLAMASIAGARRTQSSYPAFLAGTNPSDLNVAVYDPATGGGPGPPLDGKIAHLAGVERVRDVASPTLIPLTADGAPRLSTANLVVTLGSLDGEFYEQDRLTATQGRLADPERVDEIMMTASAARLLGVHLGQLVPLGLYDPSEMNLPGFGTPKVAPVLRVPARLVGIVTLDNQVVQDDIDRAYGFTVVTPALLREAMTKSARAGASIGYGIQLDHGRVDVTAVEREVIGVVPAHITYNFHVTSRVVTEVELAIKPESVALGAFGAIAALVALVLGVQAVSRQLRGDDDDRRILRALGAGPVAAAGDGLIGVLAAVVVGSLVAVAVAVALSPFSPLGPVRPVYPHPGIAFDWTVLGIGLLVLMVGLGSAAVALAYRGAPSRVSLRRLVVDRGSRAAHGAEAAGLPVAGVIGVRFALEPGRGRTAVPVRSTLLGTVLAVALLVGTLTFASGLHTLVSSPALYGWNWSYMITPSNNVPPQALKLLDRDPDVAAWSGVDYSDAGIDGQTVPFLISNLRPKVAPPILSGHDLDANRQIVLGAATLSQLHKHLGDWVTMSIGTPKDAPIYVAPTRLQIVGTATFPAVGYSSFVADHTSMGTGALVPLGVLPNAFQKAVNSSDPTLNGPELVFVRLRGGVSPVAGRANLQRIAAAANQAFASDPNAAGNYVTVLGVQRPVQIVNYRSIGSTPVILAVGLAVGAVVALALTLVASVRHRRRDLALLKSLGFTPRQLAAVVAWQSTVTALVGVTVGVPLGIVLGRQLWTVFARNIDAVPDPTVPVVSVILVALGALVFANVVAALPGRIAARTPTALVLRTE
ncbi:MAG: ABC transporter permease [Acidimicrobiales bacterium]